MCVAVDESKCLDTPIWEFSIICGASSIFYLGIHPILRLLLVHAQSGNLEMISMTFAAVI